MNADAQVRYAAIVAMRASGMTLQAIADAQVPPVTRQRVWNILDKIAGREAVRQPAK